MAEETTLPETEGASLASVPNEPEVNQADVASKVAELAPATPDVREIITELVETGKAELATIDGFDHAPEHEGTCVVDGVVVSG